MNKLQELLTRDEKAVLKAKMNTIMNAAARQLSAAYDDAQGRIDRLNGMIEGEYLRLGESEHPSLNVNAILNLRNQIAQLEDAKTGIREEWQNAFGTTFVEVAFNIGEVTE